MTAKTDEQFRADHISFDQLVENAQVFFIDGIVQGKPLGASIGQLFTKARVWGIHDRAINPKGGVGARVENSDPDDLVRDSVRAVTTTLFSGQRLEPVLRGIVQAGAAYGREDFIKP